MIMYKKFKRIISILLCSVVFVTSAINCNMLAKAAAVAAPALPAVPAVLKAIVGAAVAYAGYDATKKQNEEIAKTVGGFVNEYTNSVDNLNSSVLSSQAAYTAWCIDNWSDNPHKDILTKFAKNVYDKTLEEVDGYISSVGNAVTSETDVICSFFQKHVAELKDLISESDSTPEHTDDEYNAHCSLWVNNGIGAQAGIQTSLDMGFTAAISGIVSDIIKQDYNAEYEKTKSKYDWKSLGFKCDYDVFKQLDIKGLNNYMSSASVNAVNSFVTDKKTALVYSVDTYSYGRLTEIIAFDKTPSGSCLGDAETMAFVTVRNYDTELWDTYITSEKILWQSFDLLKKGTIGFDDFEKSLEPNLSILNNPAVTKFQSFDKGDLISSPYTFNYYCFNNSASTSPFTITDSVGNNFNSSETVTITGGSAFCINPSKTMNYFCINFTDALTCTATCSTENGTAKPEVVPSAYSNFAEEADKAEIITLNPNAEYDNTDEMAADIAADNDLALDTVENIEGTDVITEIGNTIKSIPRKIYNFFSGILNKILSAIKALPLQIVNHFLNPLSLINDTLNQILENMGISVSIPDLSNVVSALGSLELISSNQLQGILDLESPLGAIETAVEGIETAVEGIGTAVGSITDSITDSVTTPITETLTALFVPDMNVLGEGIDSLKSNFGFVNDFRGIAAKVMALNIGEHDYITVYNWNKEGNKYDKRDSYRISFSWYEPYRKYVNAIIIAFVYFIFAWRIFIKLPGIINGAAGGIATVYGLDEYMQTENEKKQGKE